MRKITDHILEGDSSNHQLEIEAQDAPGQGGANHLYRVTGFDASPNASNPLSGHNFTEQWILFQNGPIKEFGVNGITQEALLAIVIDRLRSFQAGPFACEANQKAMDHAMLSLSFLQDRTRQRIARGSKAPTRGK